MNLQVEQSESEIDEENITLRNNVEAPSSTNLSALAVRQI